MKKYYLAYGSNLNKGQMQMRCPGAVPVGTAEIKGYQLLFKGSRTGSYLTIEQKKGSVVPVGVWAVDRFHEQRLDIYEGYPSFYYKRRVKVTLKETQQEIEAFVYIMHEERPLGIPSSFYVEVCKEGYKDFGFDEKYLRAALKASVGGM